MPICLVSRKMIDENIEEAKNLVKDIHKEENSGSSDILVNAVIESMCPTS